MVQGFLQHLKTLLTSIAVVEELSATGEGAGSGVSVIFLLLHPDFHVTMVRRHFLTGSIALFRDGMVCSMRIAVKSMGALDSFRRRVGVPDTPKFSVGMKTLHHRKGRGFDSRIGCFSG